MTNIFLWLSGFRPKRYWGSRTVDAYGRLRSDPDYNKGCAAFTGDRLEMNGMDMVVDRVRDTKSGREYIIKSIQPPRLS